MIGKSQKTGKNLMKDVNIKTHCHDLNLKCPWGGSCVGSMAASQWAFGKWLDPEVSDLINGLIPGWSHSMMASVAGGV
jgi:hypothetical protein